MKYEEIIFSCPWCGCLHEIAQEVFERVKKWKIKAAKCDRCGETFSWDSIKDYRSFVCIEFEEVDDN